jgi:integrase
LLRVPGVCRDPPRPRRALTVEQITALWRLEIGVRDKTLWRLLYESAARANEILTLDVTDLDPINKRARVIGKGGDTDWVYYQTGTALLLPRLLGVQRAESTGDSDTRLDLGRVPVRLPRIGQVLTCP